MVLSDWLVVRITANPGETFLDRMIAMVEGAKRQKTPNEIALDILLAALTIIFLLAAPPCCRSRCTASRPPARAAPVTLTVLVALLVCLIPTTIGGLLPAIGIAGMDRLVQANVIAISGRAVEAAGDVDVLLLDKTGTITLGNRQAVAFVPAEGVPSSRTGRRRPALLPGRRDPGRAQHRGAGQGAIRPARAGDPRAGRRVHSVHAPQTRMSGVDPGRPRDPQGRAPRGLSRPVRICRRAWAEGTPLPAATSGVPSAQCERRSPGEWRHAAGGGRATADPGAGGDQPEGHRQGRHPGALRRTARAWASRP